MSTTRLPEDIKEKTQQNAKKILQKNTHIAFYNEQKYQYALPSKDFYTHQWFWDSCIHAMGFSYYDTKRALDELRALIAGQWENGFISHIIFNPNERKYFPGPEYWGTEGFAKSGIITSGLIQPPLLAISLNHIDNIIRERGESTEAIDSLLEQVIKYHYFIKNNRDRENYGLISIIHPWESGTDNSPRWDSILQKIDIGSIPHHVIELVQRNRTDSNLGDVSHRPIPEDYYRYWFLVDMYKNLVWDNEAILRKTPFAVKDTLVNSIWAKANDALSELLMKRGKKEKAKIFSDWAEQTKKALQKSWNPKKKLYALYDATNNTLKPFYCDTVATFLPLYAHAASEEQLTELLKKLTDPKTYWTEYPIPSTPINNPAYERARYWRGPTWPITNLFILEGLKSYTKSTQCQELWKELYKKTLYMVEKTGFYEYYDPLHLQKVGMGFGRFSWSAAIYLYLSYTYSDTH